MVSDLESETYMKCLILAAGYATRLYPLTENFPKPLLKVKGKAILEWLIDDLDEKEIVDEFIIISNHKFAHCFYDWKESMSEEKASKISILDDGTTSNADRLGAVKDIQFAVESLKLDDNMLVLAGDNLMEFSMSRLVEYARSKGASCVMRYYIEPLEILVKHGVVTIDKTDRVTGMKEKSLNPPSHWCCPALYYFIKEDLRRIPQAIEEGCGTDAPGSFVAWLCGKSAVYAMEMPNGPYDIGDMNSYKKAQEEYPGICI